MGVRSILSKGSKYRSKTAHISTRTVGVMGADDGVGCSFISLSIANQMRQRFPNVAIVNYRGKEKYTLGPNAEQIAGMDIVVFAKDDMREAFNGEFDIVVFDFGKLDRENNELVSEFQRCYRKYIVAVPSIFKRTSINNISQYYEGYKDFTTLFNLTNEDAAPAIKKMTRSCTELEDMAVFPPITDVINIDEMELFAKELFYEF